MAWPEPSRRRLLFPSRFWKSAPTWCPAKRKSPTCGRCFRARPTSAWIAGPAHSARAIRELPAVSPDLRPTAAPLGPGHALPAGALAVRPTAVRCAPRSRTLGDPMPDLITRLTAAAETRDSTDAERWRHGD